MQRPRSLSTRHVFGLFAGVAWLASAGVAAADSDLRISYSGLLCDPVSSDSAHDHSLSGYLARETHTGVVCPINRTATTLDGLPTVAIEAYNASLQSGDDLACNLWWTNEDGEGYFRGFTQVIEATKKGYVQFAFDELADYDGLGGEPSLSDGGEGTMSISCQNVRTNDRLIQYQVTENVFVF
jgi:hypothetical protein